METMSPIDASFLHVENDVTHMHIGSVGIFEGPPPEGEAIMAAIAAHLPRVPRYRQRVRFVPLALGRPVWVDDPHFRLDYHVRRTALPAPGGDDELRTLVGRVMSPQLDRNRPLWEMWVVEGLDEGRWALISKTHHCMVDGIAATDLLSVILDSKREGSAVEPDDWEPDPMPSSADLVAHSLAFRASTPNEAVRTVSAAIRGPRRVARDAVEVGKGFMSFRSLLSPPETSSLNGPIGPHRRWDWARATLGDIKRIREAHPATVNDVVLAAAAGGFRELLLARGEPVSGRVVRTLVPVSLRAETEHGIYTNKVSGMFAELPVGIADPIERLGSIHEQLQELKHSGQVVAAERLTALGGFAPAMLLSLGGRLGSRMPQHSVNTVTTNVPGPQRPLYLTGRRMLEAFPYVPLGGSVRIGIAMFSYDGAINFGVTGDRDTADDIGVLASGVEASFGEMIATTVAERPAEQATTTSRRPRSARA